MGIMDKKMQTTVMGIIGLLYAAGVWVFVTYPPTQRPSCMSSVAKLGLLPISARVSCAQYHMLLSICASRRVAKPSAEQLDELRLDSLHTQAQHG